MERYLTINESYAIESLPTKLKYRKNRNGKYDVEIYEYVVCIDGKKYSACLKLPNCDLLNDDGSDPGDNGEVYLQGCEEGKFIWLDITNYCGKCAVILTEKFESK